MPSTCSRDPIRSPLHNPLCCTLLPAEQPLGKVILRNLRSRFCCGNATCFPSHSSWSSQTTGSTKTIDSQQDIPAGYMLQSSCHCHHKTRHRTSVLPGSGADTSLRRRKRLSMQTNQTKHPRHSPQDMPGACSRAPPGEFLDKAFHHEPPRLAPFFHGMCGLHRNSMSRSSTLTRDSTCNPQGRHLRHSFARP